MQERTIRELKRGYRNSTVVKIGTLLTIMVIISSMFAPMLALQDPTQQNLEDRNLPPVGISHGDTQSTWDHPLGTDPLGRDILSRVMYGARTSVAVAVGSTMMGAAVGVTAGLFAGYYGGTIDNLVMRSVDIGLSIPGIILAATLIGVVGPMSISIPDPFVYLGVVSDMPRSFVFPGTVSIAIATLSWMEFARIARGEAISIREEGYVTISNSYGGTAWHVIRNHLLPNAFAAILVFWSIRVATAILIESTLSFLGFSGTTLSWGYDIALGRDYLATAWWVATIPGLAIVMSVIGINLVGDWLRDAFDPTMESGRGGA